MPSCSLYSLAASVSVIFARSPFEAPKRASASFGVKYISKAYLHARRRGVYRARKNNCKRHLFSVACAAPRMHYLNMTRRKQAFPAGLYFDGRKGGWSYMPGHRPHVGLGGSSRSCPHCGSLLSPRKVEDLADTNTADDFGDIDFAMID